METTLPEHQSVSRARMDIANSAAKTTSSPRVVHIVPALFGEDGVVGGAERYALELARSMARFTPTRLIAFGPRDRDEKLDDLRIQVIGRPWHVRGQPANPFAFRLFSLLGSADVVHCHQQHILTSSLAALYSRLTRRRVFVSDLGGGGWDLSGYINTDRVYHGHLHISQYSRTISGHGNKSWAHVILGGVDTDRFSPDSSVHCSGRVVFAGRLLPHKGVNDLIQAMPVDLPLDVIGRPYDPRFVDDLRLLAKDKHIFFRQDWNDEQLIQAYRNALCVVLPSVYRDMYGKETKVPELLGQTLIEAMACGTPAICTNVASMPEVVEDGVTGFVVPPNNPDALRDKLCWLRDHPAEAAQMGEAARRRVLSLFTWTEVVRRCLNIYNRRP